MSARRSGIIIRMPSSPPSTATSITRVISRSKPRIMIAGIVTPTPKAIDSPADPAVCTMLFSRIVASRDAELRDEPEQRDRDDRDRDRRAHRQADLEHQVQRRGAEDDAEQRAEHERARRHLRKDRLVADVRRELRRSRRGGVPRRPPLARLHAPSPRGVARRPRHPGSVTEPARSARPGWGAGSRQDFPLSTGAAA